MVVKVVLVEQFKKRFREKKISLKFIEHQLDEFNALRHGGRMVPDYETRFMGYFDIPRL
jgi:hypothetical protein